MLIVPPIPISFILSVTLTNMILITPIPLTNRDIPATAVINIVKVLRIELYEEVFIVVL